MPPLAGPYKRTMPFRCQPLLLTLLLISTCARTTHAQTPANSPYCLEASQMRAVVQGLRQGAACAVAVDSLQAENGLLYRQKSLLERTVTEQDSLVAFHVREQALQGRLQASVQVERDQWKAKAKARWWSSAGLGALALLLGVAAVR